VVNIIFILSAAVVFYGLVPVSAFVQFIKKLFALLVSNGKREIDFFSEALQENILRT
jgi:hypothetical protein